MQKNNYSTIIDFGSSELRLGVFDNKLSKLFFQSKNITQKDNYEEYLKSINLLIREAENKISAHLENVTVLYDTSEFLTIDLSIKKKLDQKIIIKDICSSIILEANQLIKDCYINKKIIHLIIKKYIINDKEYLNIPHETPKLDSVILEIKFICLPYNQYNNVFKTFKKNNLKIINFFSSSLVKSFNYIDFFKENKFVAFLDIGLDRTTIIFFINQKLDCLNSIPIGGNNISKDISQIMKLNLDESEKLKKTFNRSEIDFSYNEADSSDNTDVIKKIIGKNISIDLLKKVVLTRVEEIIELSFKGMNISENIDKLQDLKLVLIGNGSKIFNRNSFQIEDRYNFKEINFYEENDLEICKAGLMFEKNFKGKDPQNFKKNQKKLGFFQRFFNFFGND
jgi:cell division protein FtsA